MSTLLLVRHGQASFLDHDYDRLSPIGETQARAVGSYWRQIGLHLDRVYVGPLERQQRTCTLALETFCAGGRRPPDVAEVSGLSEHSGQDILKRRLAAQEEDQPAVPASADARGDEALRRGRLKIFRDVMQRWVRGEIETPHDLESWGAFRHRVSWSLAHVRRDAGRGETVAAFTSGGPVAAAAGDALGLDDEAIMGLSWWVRNGSVSELLFSPGRFTLVAFNDTGHLADRALLTHV